MAEHAPTPWTFRRALHIVDGQYDYAITPVDEPRVIAECFGITKQDAIEPAAANAAFIVKACNSHEALVDALHVARDAMPNTPYYQFAFDKMDEALRLARGEQS